MNFHSAMIPMYCVPGGPARKTQSKIAKIKNGDTVIIWTGIIHLRNEFLNKTRLFNLMLLIIASTKTTEFRKASYVVGEVMGEVAQINDTYLA